MLDAYEATPTPSVLLACDGREPVHNLAVILEGFGYNPLECKTAEEVTLELSKNFPCAALVCMELEDAADIFDLVNQRDDLALLVLIEHGDSDPESRARELGAYGWEYVDAPAEKILLKLRELLTLRDAQVEKVD